jgi:GNAT superfamily N-acetyltransferase
MVRSPHAVSAGYRAGMAVDYELGGAVGDRELTLMHAKAFGTASTSDSPWGDRLARHSIAWVVARDGDRLVGFVNVIGDGGGHAVLLDTVVDPEHQGRGVGRALVDRAASAASDAGCEWLHVDYEPELADFYERVCGFRPTDAGLIRL